MKKHVGHLLAASCFFVLVVAAAAFGETAKRQTVFDTDAAITLKSEVAPRESRGLATITVNKGSVVITGGAIRITTVLQIEVARGATLAQMKCSGLYKTGEGKLLLTGANTFRGLTIAAGVTFYYQGARSGEMFLFNRCQGGELSGPLVIKQGIYIGPGVDKKTLRQENNRVIQRQSTPARPKFGK